MIFKKITRWLEKNEVMIVILCLTVLARIPTLFEPYWYGDEAIYLTLGRAIRAGIPLYSGIHDNKPPFLYLLAALAGGNEFWFKFIALIWVVVTVWIFYKLAKEIFKKNIPVYLVTLGLAFLINWPRLEGNIANAELFFLLPTLTAFYLLWKKNDIKTIFLAGVMLGLGAMFKMPALLEAGVWPLVWLLGKDKDWFKKSLVLGLGVLTPILISFAYYFVAGGWQGYLAAAWTQNLPYLSSWKSAGGGKGIFSLSGRAIAAAMFAAGILIFSKKEDRRLRIAGIWGIVTLFAALLSGRPYPHYMLQAAGAMAVCGGLLIFGVKKEKLIGGVIIAAFIAAAYLFKFYGYPVTGYYKNFTQWVWGQKSTQEYFNWFDKTTGDNYKVASIIKEGTTPADKIFVWGDTPMIYALSGRLPVGRFTVKYHVLDFKAENETLNVIAYEMPKYIVSYGHDSELPGLGAIISENYREEDKIGQATIFRLRPL